MIFISITKYIHKNSATKHFRLIKLRFGISEYEHNCYNMYEQIANFILEQSSASVHL